MDPTHFLASQSLSNRSTEKITPAEIEAFYDENGLERLASWRLSLRNIWTRRSRRSDPTVRFAPAPNRV